MVLLKESVNFRPQNAMPHAAVDTRAGSTKATMRRAAAQTVVSTLLSKRDQIVLSETVLLDGNMDVQLEPACQAWRRLAPPVIRNSNRRRVGGWVDDDVQRTRRIRQ